MNTFSYYLPTKIVFEVGAVKSKLAEETKIFGENVLIVSDPGVVGAGLLKSVEEAYQSVGIKYSIFSDVEPNPSTETVMKAAAAGEQINATVVLAVGGGSPIDVAKGAAIILTNGGHINDYNGINKVQKPTLPLICVPTTAGTGSEVTPFAVITQRENKYKMTIGSPYCLPKVALLDPYMVSTVPSKVAAACGMDALTHAIESYVNKVASPITDALGAQAMRMIHQHLRAYVADRGNIEAASGMIVASLLAGIAFGVARLGNVHAMAHPLGGFFDVPHGVANAILLPKVMAWNLIGAIDKFAEIAVFLGKNIHGLSKMEAARAAVVAVEELMADIEIPKSLSEVGVKEEAIPAMAIDAMKSGNVLINPRTTTVKDIEYLFRISM